MGCGCRKNKTAITRTQAGANGGGNYEVVLNGVRTGRRFTSLVSAQTYADRIGGTVENI